MLRVLRGTWARAHAEQRRLRQSAGGVGAYWHSARAWVGAPPLSRAPACGASLLPVATLRAYQLSCTPGPAAKCKPLQLLCLDPAPGWEGHGHTMCQLLCSLQDTQSSSTEQSWAHQVCADDAPRSHLLARSCAQHPSHHECALATRTRKGQLLLVYSTCTLLALRRKCIGSAL